jgi:hypothetical protein
MSDDPGRESQTLTPGTEAWMKKYNEQREELYAAIGRFAVKFEHVCHAMSTSVSSVLQFDGLQNGAMAEAVVTGLTADPLLAIFRSAILAARESDEDRKVLADVCGRIRKLIEERNDVIHRTWWVGWTDLRAQDFSSADSWKIKHTAKGAELRPREGTRDNFDDLSREADELTDAVQRITGCMLLGSPLEVKP